MKFVSLALFLIGAVIYVGLCLAGFLSLRKKQLSPLNGFAFEAMPKSENRKTFLYFLFGLATVCLGLSPLAMVGCFLNSGIASNATLLMFGMLMFIGSGALMYLPWITGADKPKKHIYGFVLAICLLATSSLVYGLNFMGNAYFGSEGTGSIIGGIAIAIALVSLFPCLDKSLPQSFTLNRERGADGYFVGVRNKLIRLALYEWLYPLFSIIVSLFGLLGCFGISGL